jgi:formate hydrogenlyase subunit 6/NADH:ubiquinone oxidoreductase subunit I
MTAEDSRCVEACPTEALSFKHENFAKHRSINSFTLNMNRPQFTISVPGFIAGRNNENRVS